ncbi:kinase, partial [Escherichia coli]
MIISPPILHAHIDTEKDSDWVNRMMSVDPERNFPMNSGRSWHGGVHLNGNLSETVRCIADGKVISIRQPEPAENTVPPLNYNGVTDKGYVLIKHETEIGSGE